MLSCLGTRAASVQEPLLRIQRARGFIYLTMNSSPKTTEHPSDCCCIECLVASPDRQLACANNFADAAVKNFQKTTDSEDWEEELKELIPVMLGMGGRGFKEYSPLILLIEKVEKAARESGRESVNEIYLTREEAYKKGYESGKNDVVDYLEKNLPKSGNDGRVIHRSTLEQARLLDT